MKPNSILNLVIQPIGLLCATLVLFSIIGLAIIDKRLANRMTVRLIAAIAFADILAHVGEIYASSNGWLPLGSQLCAVVSGFRVASRTFYNFTNIAICFHLYGSLVLLKKSTWRFELYTWIFTVSMVFILTIIYWSMGAFSGKLNKVGCNPGADDYTLNKVFLFMAGFTDLITVLIGIFITIVGHRSLKIWINTYAESRSYKGEDPDIFKRNRMKMAKRAFLYPLATCITLPFEALFLIFYGFGYINTQLGYLKAATLGLSGILTGIAFSVDPATHKAFSEAYTQVKINRINRQQMGDNRSGSTINIPLANKL
ncbi:hypothetical protein CONCODRAFT_2537 [Conidiobolus coronatus NRRL 28638]|uniref:G-protein coupled receptors family 1 profile domain-containing protein n=1 Tax=Conidiobolus coronatus (strain ATCC 28846 / CBS 209.66 / NRRL 28638) TaxID=796925 RepID=A0A137PH58_CONC2|nr:hypothetical protein CONCODRAFT_2537 [Conidiobolus coronatus NRRL 28638]|eukprot:KXN74333.1 hypothetical protein CONCODRAFT_2537 [Conidiobolus coronatus NRRL 28638]